VSEADENNRLIPGAGPHDLAGSAVVNAVYDRVLADIHGGRLQPGERISDAALAKQLGVSRTPVREALQRLREIGIIEVSASRFTRVAIVSPRQTADATIVWVALYGALLAEVIPVVPAEVVAAMERDHERFLATLATLDMQKIAAANADYFSNLVRVSHNSILRRGIDSVVHRIQLGSLHLPDRIDLRALSEAQALLLGAARDRDTAAARGALRLLGLIAIPTDPLD
jgi:DNA-binding GntR family transcriptional regulator